MFTPASKAMLKYFMHYFTDDDAPGCEAFSDDEDIEEAEGGKYKCSFHISK